MQIKVFTIPLSNTEVSEAEANAFLRGHRVLQVDRHFSSEGGGYWTLFVEYMEGDPSDKVPPELRFELCLLGQLQRPQRRSKRPPCAREIKTPSPL